jgi:hypothetical protein
MVEAARPKYWGGTEPTTCNICRERIHLIFIDGATVAGTWMILCPGCHAAFGCGTGAGKGQLYVKQPDGKWMKMH